MKHSIKDRLRQVATDKGFSIRSFEEICGLTRGNISNMGQDTSIGSDKLEKIINTFPDIDLHWLITGNVYKGDNTIINNSSDKTDLKPVTSAFPQTLSSGVPLLSMYDLEKFITNKNVHESYPQVYFPGLIADFIVPITIDSMEPRFNRGDYVACNLVTYKDKYFQYGKVYLLLTDDGIYLNTVQKGTISKTLQLVSANKVYSSFEYPISSIKYIALVRGLVRLG